MNHKKKYISLNEPGNASLNYGDAVFGSNNSLIWQVYLGYRPGQKYMERPNRKINLGTRWPFFGFTYEKGIGGFGSLDADYDLLKLSVSDEHSLGMVGRLKWKVEGAWFANNDFVPFMNWQHFNTSEVHMAKGGLANFKALPYYASSTDQYAVQAHIEQHFHGFFFNKIPLIKKLKWQMVGGVHYLYEPTYGHYWEVTAGIENIFKLIRVDAVFPFRESTFQQFAFRFQLGF